MTEEEKQLYIRIFSDMRVMDWIKRTQHNSTILNFFSKQDQFAIDMFDCWQASKKKAGVTIKELKSK